MKLSSGIINFLYAVLVTGTAMNTSLADDLSQVTDEPNPGIATQIAGGSVTEDGQPALLSRLDWYPRSVGVDSLGRVYFTDGHFSVSRIETDGTLTNFIDDSYWGSNPVHESEAYFNSGFSLSNDYLYYDDGEFNDNGIYVRNIYRINLLTNQHELYATLDDSLEPEPNWDVWAIAANEAGDVFVHANNRIYLVDKDTRGTTHIAGNGTEFPTGDDIPAIESGGFSLWTEMALDPTTGNPVIADVTDYRIYEVQLSTGRVKNLATNLDIEPVVNYPWQMPIYINRDGEIFISNQDKIYRFFRNGGTTVHIAGNGQSSFNGDGRPLLDSWIRAVEFTGDEQGNLFISSMGGETTLRIRKLDLNRDFANTIVGVPGYLGCASPLEAPFFASDVGVADNGVVYVNANRSILAIDERLGSMYTVAGVYGALADSTPAQLDNDKPINIDDSVFGGSFAVSPNGDIYFMGDRDFDRRIRSIHRVNATRSRVDTIASGYYHLLYARGNDFLYAIEEQGSYVNFVRINTNTGAVTTILTGGDLLPVVGESAEGRRFQHFYGSMLDFLVDEKENIYLSINNVDDPDFLSGIYKIDAETKVLSALVTTGKSEGSLGGWLALDEKRNLLYVSNVSDNDSFWSYILKIDLATGGLSRYFDDDFIYQFVVSSSGELYTPGVSRISDSITGASRAPADIGANSNLGRSVAGNSSWLAIGAPNRSSGANGSGEVFLYKDNDCRPIYQQRLGVPESARATKFGETVAFTGERLVVAAESSASARSDSVFRLGAFSYNQGNESWELSEDLSDQLPPGTGEMALYVDEEILAVGTPEANNGSGLVTVFDSATLNQAALLQPGEPGVAGFGKSLAGNGSHLAVGAHSASEAAIADIYRAQGNAYTRVDQVASPSGNPGFATALAMNDSALYVGAPGPGGGKVFDYRLGGSLVLADTLSDPVKPDNASFGTALAIEDGLLVVGAPGTQIGQNFAQSENGKQSTGFGSAIAFGVKDRSGRSRAADSLFTLSSSDAEAYGASVDIDEGRIVVGAPQTNNGEGAFEAAGEIANPADLSGLWYDPDFDGEGYNVLVAGNAVVIYFYGYTRDGERLWLVSRNIEGSIRFGETINIPMLRTIEGSWSQSGSPQEALVEWGVLSVTFGTLNSATFSLNGWDGSKITKGQMLLNATNLGGPYSGLWYDPSADGEGYNVISGDVATIVFYYGHTADGKGLWLMSDGYTGAIENGTQYEVAAYEITGGGFYNPSAEVSSWGTMNVQFDNCKEGRIILEGRDGSKTSDIVKLASVFDSGCQ